MTAFSPSVAEAVRCAGGWLFDQVLAGWDVTVVTPDEADPRPLRILGVRGSHLEDALSAPLAGHCLEAVALHTDLYAGDERLRSLVQRATDANDADIRLWGDAWPEDFDDGAGPVPHRLSVAARAFKAQALAAIAASTAAGGAAAGDAAGIRAQAATDTEVFRRGTIRRPLLAVGH